MSEFMNKGPSPASSSSGQAPLSGRTASDSGMAPQKTQAMAALRPRTLLSRQMQDTPLSRRKAVVSKPNLLPKREKRAVAKMSKKDMKKRVMARMLKNKKSMKKRAVVKTLRP